MQLAKIPARTILTGELGQPWSLMLGGEGIKSCKGQAQTEGETTGKSSVCDALLPRASKDIQQMERSMTCSLRNSSKRFLYVRISWVALGGIHASLFCPPPVYSLSKKHMLKWVLLCAASESETVFLYDCLGSPCFTDPSSQL